MTARPWCPRAGVAPCRGHRTTRQPHPDHARPPRCGAYPATAACPVLRREETTVNHSPNLHAQRQDRLGVAAVRAAAAGWPVFPVRPRGKTPAVPDWDNAATTDIDQITA